MMRIIHVAPQLSISGKTGGSYSVAYNLAQSLGQRGHSVLLVSHSGGKGIQSRNNPGFQEFSCDSFLLLKKIDPSSYIPTRGFRTILKEIASCDVVHIHLAREVFPILCAFIGIFWKKKVIIQCHGMVIRDSRTLVRVLDWAVLSFIFDRAHKVLALTSEEKKRLVFANSRTEIFGNGINFTDRIDLSSPKKNEIIFLGRLHKVKRPVLFLETIAKYNLRFPNALSSYIFGPDGGLLDEVKNHSIYLRDKRISLGGSLESHEIPKILGESKVLFVTSLFENFPMVVLEAISVGTPVLIFSHFDFAQEISGTFPEMVVNETETEEILSKLEFLSLKSGDISYQRKIVAFARERFDLRRLTSRLEDEIY